MTKDNQPAGHTAGEVIALIADVADTIGWGAGEPGMEIAGGIVSFLAAHPEHIDRFMANPSDVILGGDFDPHKGCLTWRAVSGEMMNRAKYEEALALRRAQPEQSAQRGEV